MGELSIMNTIPQGARTTSTNTLIAQENAVSEYMLGFKPSPNVQVRVEIIYTGTLTQDVFQKTIQHLQLDMEGFDFPLTEVPAEAAQEGA